MKNIITRTFAVNVTSAEHEFMYSITVISAMGSHIRKLLK